ECGKSFSCSSHPLQNQKIQTKEHPCWCWDCGKSFSKNSHHIKNHKIHIGEWPYQC
ncbi:ZN470 protein, partial [Sitta europaea]|nr:ZN470 protein [Sitta europaea]